MISPRRRVLALIAGGLLAAITVSACGLPEDDKARDISADAVPFDLLAPASTTVPDRPPGATQIENLYFQNEDRLEAVPKEIDGNGDPDIVITALLETNGADLPQGLKSDIPPATELLGTSRRGDVLTIDLSDDLNGVEGDLLIFAVAQLVYTATGLTGDGDGITRVRLQIDGEPISVPNDDGVEQEGPVSRTDYLNLAPLALG
jgi:spore germination protein GerM